MSPAADAPVPPAAPRVSVVVPVLDAPEALAACLAALSSQVAAPPFEVVVVDDGSCRDLQPARVAWHGPGELVWRRLPVNRGPAAARNHGVAAARGEVVLFTDADCRPDPGWVAALSRPLLTQPDVVGAKGCYRSGQRDRWARLAQVEFEERYELLAAAGDIDFIDTYSGAYRRAALLAVGGFDEAYPVPDNEDVDLAFRVHARGGRFVFVREACVVHRHREGCWRYLRLKLGRGFWRMKVYARHPGKAGRESYTPGGLKLQLLLAPLLLGAAVAGLTGGRWRRTVRGVGGGVLAAFLASCAGLLRAAWRCDPGLLPWVPPFALLRALALAAGMLGGLVCFLPEWWRGAKTPAPGA